MKRFYLSPIQLVKLVVVITKHRSSIADGSQDAFNVATCLVVRINLKSKREKKVSARFGCLVRSIEFAQLSRLVFVKCHVGEAIGFLLLAFFFFSITLIFFTFFFAFFKVFAKGFGL